MVKIRWLFLLCYIVGIGVVCAQQKVLSGIISASGDVEGIHVINKTASKFTKTEVSGSFSIPASLHDTLKITGVKYQSKEVVVTSKILNSEQFKVRLEDQITELDEVIVGKVLTGDLMSDIQNSEAKRDINFYDVGIPGYTGKPLTQNERKLSEADSGQYVYFAVIALSINVHKILNKISGRTKKLKYHVKLEQQDACMNKAKSEFSEILFGGVDLEEGLIAEYFYYVSEDPQFLEICNLNNAKSMYDFLVLKLESYNDNIESDED